MKKSFLFGCLVLLGAELMLGSGFACGSESPEQTRKAPPYQSASASTPARSSLAGAVIRRSALSRFVPPGSALPGSALSRSALSRSIIFRSTISSGEAIATDRARSCTSTAESVIPLDPETNFIGNIESMKFHLESCEFAQVMAKHRQVRFKGREKARELGMNPCNWCMPSWTVHVEAHIIQVQFNDPPVKTKSREGTPGSAPHMVPAATK